MPWRASTPVCLLSSVSTAMSSDRSVSTHHHAGCRITTRALAVCWMDGQHLILSSSRCHSPCTHASSHWWLRSAKAEISLKSPNGQAPAKHHAPARSLILSVRKCCAHGRVCAACSASLPAIQALLARIQGDSCATSPARSARHVARLGARVASSISIAPAHAQAGLVAGAPATGAL